MFYSYLEYHVKGLLDDRKYELVDYIEKYFDSNEPGIYYIMDPYLDIDKIWDSFKENNVDDVLWSFLLSILSQEQVSFNIITREKAENMNYIEETPPFTLPISDKLNDCPVRVCIYPDTKYFGLALHDRYILKVNGEDVKGMHFGPSLGQINDIDITVTLLSQSGAIKAVEFYKQLWDECVNQKGWKKG